MCFRARTQSFALLILFEWLNIPTKSNTDIVKIITPIELIKKGDKVGSFETAFLAKLGIRPFSYGLVVLFIYDNGSVFSPEVLNLTEDDLVDKFAAGVSMLESELKQWHDSRASIGCDLQSRESSVTKMKANLLRKDKAKAELLSSLASADEEIAKLKKALKYAKESRAILEDDLANAKDSRRQTLEKLEPAEEKLAKLRSAAAKTLDTSKDSIRAEL
ncbi:60S acidic ribosomal protein P0-like [Asparagus officinalis]|uniref:60S acidic ribosomal protein P0-like n=1 Tax=Asparagus officinalis TaxID=4686 RepID=UPI00098E1FFB|nr:60S acidic ribosomal protein P0-like [Asparagus officinalis]